MRLLAEEAASVLQKGTASVAVNCLSGRGRTGTFSAIALGKLLSIKTHSELIDAIVSMRENRDGLVETPAQFRYAAIALNLPDTTNCNIACIAKKSLESLTPNIYIPFLSGILLSVAILLSYIIGTKSTFFSSLQNGYRSIGRNNKYRHMRHFTHHPDGVDVNDDSDENTGSRSRKQSIL